jgi:hypothetical protein
VSGRPPPFVYLARVGVMQLHLPHTIVLSIELWPYLFFFCTAWNNVSNEFISFTSIPHVRNLYCRTGVYIYYTWQTRALVFKTQQSKTARGQYSTIFIFNRNFLAFPFLISFTDIMRNNQHRARPPTAGGGVLYIAPKKNLSAVFVTHYINGFYLG